VSASCLFFIQLLCLTFVSRFLGASFSSIGARRRILKLRGSRLKTLLAFCEFCCIKSAVFNMSRYLSHLKILLFLLIAVTLLDLSAKSIKVLCLCLI
jgi:hypothetical protein